MVRKEDFLIPCSFEERRPYWLDQFLFIPSEYEGHTQFKPEGGNQIFPGAKKTCLELCSGNGEWILHNAEREKEIAWIAVEKKFDRARNIWIQMKKRNLGNLFLIFGEALTFLRYYLEKYSVDTLFINFPDPWPKRRHAKNRLINSAFLREVEKVLKPKGSTFLVTDSKDYLRSSIQSFFEMGSFTPLFAPPHYLTEWEDFGASFFQRLWKERNRTIFYTGFKKCLC